MVKVLVSVARVSSLTRTVKVKLPAVVGTPLTSPELPAKSNSFVPGGRRPSTTLNDGSLFDDAQPVTVMKNMNSVRPGRSPGRPGGRSCTSPPGRMRTALRAPGAGGKKQEQQPTHEGLLGMCEVSPRYYHEHDGRQVDN